MDRSADKGTVVLAVGIDDEFAVPLLVMLRSACGQLSPGWSLEVFILEHRVAARSRARIESGLAGLPVQLRWKTPDLEGVRARLPGIRVAGEVSVYFRLLIGEQLPESVERVIFLDTDLLIRGDLVELWKLPFDGSVVQAVPDAYAGTLHLPRLRRVAAEGVAGIREGMPYFNAGVLLVDLRAWRQQSVGEHSVDLLLQHGDRLMGRDQDALNLILADRWKPLAPTWNFHELPHCLFLWETGELSRAELGQSFRDPQIVHFIGHWQPWGRQCSQMYHQSWRRVAATVGVEAERQAFLPSLWHRLVREPHARLNWYLWRGVLQASEPGAWRHIALVLLTHPWMVMTYPLWQARIWLDFRVRRPLRRRWRERQP